MAAEMGQGEFQPGTLAQNTSTIPRGGRSFVEDHEEQNETELEHLLLPFITSVITPIIFITQSRY